MHFPASQFRLQTAAAVVLLGCCAIAAADTTPQLSPIEQGKRIYRQGLLISGKPLSAKIQGQLDVAGQYLACAGCHRRSGFGSYEGGIQIPPIAGRVLFSTSSGHGYSDASLKQAILSGIAADGRNLNPLMPRYALPDQDLEALIAYLKTLSAQDSPGADQQTLHFATIIGGAVSPGKRKLMLEMMQKYIAVASSATPGQTEPRHTAQSRAALRQNKRRSRIPNYFPFRKLELHVWELKGPRSGWAEQLNRYYRKQAVFAVVGGIATGSWQPIHDFCEANELPCLFANTAEPVIREHDVYNVYFNKGMSLEGETIATHLRQTMDSKAKIVQVFRGGDSFADLAVAGLTEEAEELGLTSIRNHQISSPEALTVDFWNRLLQTQQPEILVLWLPPADLAALQTLDLTRLGLKRLYLSATLTGGSPALSDPLQAITYLSQRTLIPGTPAYSQIENLVNTNAAGVSQPADDNWLINDTQWTTSLVSEVVRQMQYNNRELLLEMIEMFAGRKPPLQYPRLSLTAEQRFASKGGFVFQPGKPEQAEWIVP